MHREGTNTSYSMPGGLRTLLLGGMVLGAICLVMSWFMGDEIHTRFWTNLLHNGVFFTGIGLMATFFLTVCVTAWAGWHTVFKRVWEAFSLFLIPGSVIMFLFAIAVFMHMNHLYHWADTSEATMNDTIIQGKTSFLNTKVYLILGGIILTTWCFFAVRLRGLSVDEDANGTLEFTQHRSMRWYSAAFLPIAGFTSAAMIWLWIMSLDAHWYSTMFAWYSGASLFVSMICLTIIILVYLKNKGYYEEVTPEHIHDLGKFLFAFSIFWTYLWFSQYMLIWYANVGEETIYFRERHDNYPVLFWGNLVINFVLPFFVLMRNDTKRKFGSVAFVAVIVLFGHWLDFFQMIKPGARHSAQEHLAHAADHGGDSAAHAEHAAHHVGTAFEVGYTIPGFIELGTGVGFLCFFLYWTFSKLSQASLVPKNDPYLAESLHHHV